MTFPRRALASGIALAALLVLGGGAYMLVHGGVGGGHVGSAPSCRTCRIRVTHVATLGRRTDSVSPDTWAELARDSRGRYYVAPTVAKAQIAVYDSLGQLIRTIGQRGAGPGEFQLIQSVAIGSHDTLFVLDVALRRLTALSPSYAVVRTVPLAKAGYHLTILPDGTMLVGSLSPFPGPSAGQPVHLLSKTGELIRSFGVVSPDLTRERFSSNARTFALARGGGIWLAPYYRYELELWGLDGRERRSITRTVDWFPAWTDFHQQPMDVVPPRTALGAIRQDTSGRLWVFLSVADKDWQQGRTAAGVHGSREAPAAVSAPEGSRNLDTIIEVIDPERGELVASTRVPESIEGLLGDDLAYGWRSDSLGDDYIDIWRLRLAGAAPP